MTVSEWLDKWLTMRADPHGEAPLRVTTVASYRQHVDTHLRGLVGRHRLRDLRASHVLAMRRDLRALGLSPATVERITATLRSAVNEAYSTGLMAANPFTRAGRNRKGKGTTISAKVEPWTIEEWQKFATATAKDRHSTLYRLAADGGMRRGELLALLWDDVDLDAGTVKVVRNAVQIGSTIVIGEPKTDAGSGRIVHLTPGTVTALRKWSARQAADRLAAGDTWTDTGLVFTDTLGEGLQPKSVSQAFRRAAIRAKVRACRFHDLRHLSASLGAAAGESVLEVSKRLGHADPGFTQRVYQHVWETQASASAAKRGNVLDGAVGE
jgi:integrase